MKTYNCLIVDDEPIARAIIRNYCSYLPALHIASECGNALEAKQAMQEQDIAIMFLDINLPVLDGLNFLKTLRSKPQVIFTTAFKEYALNAFDLSACDYLLKPFSLERFIVAVDKALERLEPTGTAPPPPARETVGDFIFLRTEGRIFQIPLSDLLYAEASGNYTKVITETMDIRPAMPLSGIEKMLPVHLFSKIHRSFIVNRSKISHIEGNRVFVRKTGIPIGSNYREAFLRTLGL
ncbi:MAG TPA: LytTR family DNA-binding domain-containing protein [Puia sp.]|uniref:LytR/AlgR family response regulator transcription factor n=1 Tax=Puia sp. TaxID=2045100 RepID=UPI002C6EE361|nr:LytTR family DNA-binding domain-containing protein [Puia sp.]HVU95555.1 LytTR family DNA-binding domain-containing protein [Puia sp.]